MSITGSKYGKWTILSTSAKLNYVGGQKIQWVVTMMLQMAKYTSLRLQQTETMVLNFLSQ